MPACSQCRQRKVRCSGGPDSCEACTRLGFQCSLVYPTTSVSPETGGRSDPPRKRGGRACDSCHAQRVRCVSEQGKATCHRCWQLGITCVYSLSVRQYRVQESRRRQADSAASSQSKTPREVDSIVNSTIPTWDDPQSSPATSASGELDRILGCSKIAARRHIEAYFVHIHPVLYFSFLHRADILRQYSLGTLSPILLLAICGAASRFLPFEPECSDMATSWIERAETITLRSLGKASISKIQTLMILGYNRRCNHQSNKTFYFLPLAARMAYLLKLHKENIKLPFVEQECRRRLMWCIFTVDRFAAGGVPEYITLPVAGLNIQLPCQERNFETDVPVRTGNLLDHTSSTSELSLSALSLRLFHVRNQVLQYTKALLETATSPEQSIVQFNAFEADFRRIHGSLPEELHFSARAVHLRAFSPERNTFIIFHIFFHHCHCELYRLLNPGYREALPEAVILATSPDLVAYAQSQCLKHAVAIGDIIKSTYQPGTDDLYTSDVGIFVLLYQASCAILYACHRDSPAFTMSPDIARGYFSVFIAVLTGLTRYFPKFAIYVDDIRNMLRSIDDPGAPLPRQKAPPDVDFRARPVPSDDSEEDESATIVKNTTLTSPASAFTSMDRTLQPDTGITMVPAAMIDESMQTHLDPNVPPTEPDSLWPYLEATEYGLDGMIDPDQALLWNWADALGSTFVS
ncbi:fungal-specific transcription factor domain-containing protein [Pyrenochaeta sp. MPI-SDFR-AT-0127]|nr:fungal-specific transcription factor domain-containing protein [Pyrenochaeta sp. MPI-SDFR-AT-0127]